MQEQGKQQAKPQQAPGDSAGDVDDGQAARLVVLPNKNGRWPLPNNPSVRKTNGERPGFWDEGMVWGVNGRSLHRFQLNEISKMSHRTSLFVTERGGNCCGMWDGL